MGRKKDKNVRFGADVGNQQKAPRSEENPTTSRALKIAFCTEVMDYDGRWGWHQFEASELRLFLRKVLDFQSYNFSDLGQQGSHFVKIDKLIKEARDRLTEVSQDDLEHLYSLRLEGKKRVWCIGDNQMLRLLWWDPYHQICPSLKKHT